MNNKGKKITINKKKEKSKKNEIKIQKNNFLFNTKISNNNILFIMQKKLYSDLKSKYNSNKKIYEIFLVDCLLNNANCRLVSIFKEHLINDYIEEFLHRKYKKSECLERIPKFYKYYKNYLLFFCKPIFRDMFFNNLVQHNGEKKAEIYYKRNYLKSKSIDNIKDCGFEKTDSDNSSESKNNSKIKKDGTIFNESVKEKLENITVMTTLSNETNKTVNLNMDNEKLEVFCENKYDKSNDTTVVDFINKYQKELEKKNKKKLYKKFNHSFIFRNCNFSRNKYANKIKTNATSYKLLLDNNLHNLSKNKSPKKKILRNKSHEKNEVKDDKNNRKISVEKVKKFLKIYFSNSKDDKYNKKLVNNKEEKPKTNISLKLIHKGYYKFENEINKFLINFRNNLKDKYNQLYSNFPNPTEQYKSSNKSRNDNNKLLYKQSSIFTINNIYATQNNKNKNLYVYNTSNKSYINSNSTINMKINKKNIRPLNNNEKINLNGKSHKKMINISIKTENSNNILNYKNNISKNHKNIIVENNNKYNSSKNHHSKNIIKINKNDKLFQNKKISLKKDKPVNIAITDIKNNNLKINNNTSSKEKNNSFKLKIIKKKTYNKSRNYISYSSLGNLYDGFSSKNYYSKNKSINFNNSNNLNNNNQTYNSNKNILNKKENLFNKKSNDKNKIKKINSNLMHISLPSLNYEKNIYNKSKINNNKHSQKYINSFNNILNQNKNGKNLESKKKNYKSISNIFNSDSKFKKFKNMNYSNSKYKSELYNNNSSYKNNKYNKTIVSYITKNVSNKFK